MSSDWIKLYRKSLDSGWLSNHKLWAFWSYCLLKARWVDGTAIVGNSQVMLNPGQFIFGRKKAASELGMSEQNIRTCLRNLVELGNLTITPTNKYTVVTVINWERDQSKEDILTSRPTSNQPTSQPVTNHIKEGKNKEGKNTIEKTKKEIAASIIFEHYVDLVVQCNHADDDHRKMSYHSRTQSEKNIVKLLKTHDQEDLVLYADNYFKNNTKTFPFKCSNFYGRDAHWKDHTILEQPSSLGSELRISYD